MCEEKMEKQTEENISDEKTNDLRKNDLMVIAIVSNAIATLVLAVAVIFMAFGSNVDFPTLDAGQNAGAHIFKGKSVSYDKAMKDSKNVVVLFYADWCPHCRHFGPTFEKLSKDRKLKKQFNFVRINSESEQAVPLMEEYEVKGFPSLFLVDPKSGEKHFISNNLLFGDDAQNHLKEIFKSFAKRNDSKK